MKRCDSATEALVALETVIVLIRQLTLQSTSPKTARDFPFSWFEDCAHRQRRAFDACLQVYCEFPSLRGSPNFCQEYPLWYWLVGSPGLMHELQHHPSFAAVVSSRQSHRNEDRQRWFRKFLQAARSIDRAQDWWLYFPTIATGPISEHVARRCEMKSVKCETLSYHALLDRLSRLATEPMDFTKNTREVQCWITPALDSTTANDFPQSHFASQKKRDRKPSFGDALSIHLPQRLHVIDLREGGNIDRLLEERLLEDRFQDPSVRIYRLKEDRTHTRDTHLQQGAIDWILLEPCPLETTRTSEASAGQHPIYNPIFSVSSFCAKSNLTEWPYLTHCTRARVLKWSDTKLSSDWDRWLLDGLPEETSPWETLLQIAHSQRLMSFPDMTRDKIPTISFSAVPLVELLSRRAYRSHLRRWDWEPYGLCVQKSALRGFPVREVIYGEESTWNDLDRESRPWFQPRFSRNGKLDWQEEKEWRLLGDLRLRKLPWESIFFFVPSRAEAERLSRISPWPVAVVEPRKQKNRKLLLQNNLHTTNSSST
jgi:hypothetical protein